MTELYNLTIIMITLIEIFLRMMCIDNAINHYDNKKQINKLPNNYFYRCTLKLKLQNYNFNSIFCQHLP